MVGKDSPFMLMMYIFEFFHPFMRYVSFKIESICPKDARGQRLTAVPHLLVLCVGSCNFIDCRTGEGLRDFPLNLCLDDFFILN